MSEPRVLIACVGNIFLGDDGFGVEVARRFASRPRAAGVTVRDFGVRGIDLVYALIEPWDLVVLVDAAPRGGAPGALYVIEPDWPPPAQAPGPAPALPMHQLDPATVLAAAAAMGSAARRVLVLGCEPTPLDPRDFAPGLSPAVLAAVDPAIERLESLIARETQTLA